MDSSMSQKFNKSTSVVGGLSWTFLNDELLYKILLRFLELAEDPLAIEEIYLHKYFQIFIYFIWIDRKMQAVTVAGSDFSNNSNKIDKNLKIFMEVDLLNGQGALSQLKKSEQYFIE